MTKQITTYTANVTGISANNLISSASEVTARQNTSTAINNTGEVVTENRALLEAIHTTDHIINVISTSFSGGTNQLAILADAITWWDESVYRADKTANASLTGWPAKTITGLTTSNTFYIWATFVSGTKDYEATNITAALPSNITEKALIGIATVSGAGAVTFAINWQGPTQTRENYFSDAQYFQNTVNIKGDATFQGQVFNILPAFYHDMQIEYLTVSTIRIKAGSRCRSADNTKDVIFASNYTVDMSNATPTSTTGGRSVAELANQMYCIYVGLDSAGLPLAWLDTADLSAGGTPTNPAAYSSSRRQLKFLIRNDGSSNILNFLITGNFYEYLDSILVYSTVSLAGTPVTVSASGYVPAGERSALFTYAHNSNGSQSYLQVQSRVGGAQFFVGSANTTSHIGFGMYTIGLNSSGQHNINAATNTSNTTIYLRGYYV